MTSDDEILQFVSIHIDAEFREALIEHAIARLAVLPDLPRLYDAGEYDAVRKMGLRAQGALHLLFNLLDFDAEERSCCLILPAAEAVSMFTEIGTEAEKARQNEESERAERTALWDRMDRLADGCQAALKDIQP